MCIQLHDSPGRRRAFEYSKAGFSNQHGYRAWVCTTEEKRSIVRVLLAEGIKAKNVHEEMYPLYGGKCLSRKAVPN
jgi:hypothetical protein